LLVLMSLAMVGWYRRQSAVNEGARTR
jgi:hypothetical protein